MALGVAVEAADVIHPAPGAERTAHREIGAVGGRPAAFDADARAHLAAELGGANATDVIERATRRIGGGDGGAAAAHRLDALERGVGPVEIAGAVIAEIDVGDRQPVLLHGDIILAGGAVAAVGGDAARVNHAADFAQRRIHEDTGNVEQQIVGADGDLLGHRGGVDRGDGGGGLLDFGGVEHPRHNKVIELHGIRFCFGDRSWNSGRWGHLCGEASGEEEAAIASQSVRGLHRD